MGLDKEIESGQGGRLHQRMERFRAMMGRHPVLLLFYRLLVIGVGFLCIVAGIIMLVTPGPGWLFIFMGMSLWGTEFHWAHRLNVWARAKVLSIWRELEAKRQRVNRRRTAARWAGRTNSSHYCPTGCHYRETS
ncbi:PGPGW domain-containing protein [Rothia nasimurium]|uniref:PGPGW domain-containing protein n=1 Tax=Rothia nasimurium TaxID=85336 RepID=UPI001F398B75|nr:PGPGW domain-containing protein [Rothia nasimurium]